jgi:hypothetical protein
LSNSKIGEALNRKAKLAILFLLGTCIYIPLIFLYSIAQLFIGALVSSVGFLLYCYLLYHFVYKRAKPKYPMVPPEGRMDVYYPRTNIPRPIYEDVRRYPEFFGRKKEKYKRARRVKKKS